jgi:hypothetical protein
MVHLDKAFGFMSAPHQWVSRKVSRGGDESLVWCGECSVWL